MISSERIPNNVDLAGNKRLQRALEHWQPAYLDWWRDMGPPGFQDHHQVYLRTAISVDAAGWAHFDYVKLPEYRWGIFLAEPTHDRRIGFGDFKGQPVWQEVPGEFRNQLRRLIVIQGDTEPASVEQQRSLGAHCPSLYDLRNLFQVNVEEGRHLWAMVYLLHSYFGRDGREEAEALLERRSGNSDTPRMLEAFNEPIDTWLDFFAFTMFTDRDGKSQLLSLSESSLDPLSRTTRFMLTEEAHHMFVGESGLSRILERSCQLLRESGFSGDVRKAGGIDLPLIQKFVNFWFSQSLDLHGSEVSGNAATYFSNGLKGRAEEDRYEDDHVLAANMYMLDMLDDSGRIIRQEVPMRNALNEVLRDWYVGDCQAGVDRWNKRVLEAHGMSDRIALPSRKFNRKVGVFAGKHFDPLGNPLTPEEWDRRKHEWLPSPEDKAYLHSIQATPVYKPGQFANYIAPPARGINRLPLDFEYVRTEL
ncbi:MAG TPA: benzoyl-CoA 2,3-epoxidase subunit BoxB [Vicinamibacterales bacterium]|nr:benzoyl-CoA 2,3-epoxidase subunit BoxB [Vicinamibacterales bacterium]